MYIVTLQHNSGAEERVTARESYADAVDIVYNFFLSYDFEIKNGKPWDGGNANPLKPNAGFEVFTDVKMFGMKVVQFTHCGGDGPVAKIKQSE